MNRMHVMGTQGDIIVEWDPEDADSVAKAKTEWAQLQKAGFEFFKDLGNGKQRRVKTFNKKTAKVIAAPGVQHKSDKAIAPGRPTRRRQGAMAGGPTNRPVRMPRFRS